MIHRWWRRLFRRFPEPPSRRPQPGGASALLQPGALSSVGLSGVGIVPVTAVGPAAEFAEHLERAGLQVTIERIEWLRHAAGQLVVLLVPATLRTVSELADVLHIVEELAVRGRRIQLVVVWCTRDTDRLTMAAPYATAPGYDISLSPAGWNAGRLFLANAWRRHLRDARGNPVAATLHRDRLVRTLLVADSHRRVCGQDIARVMDVLHWADPQHLHTVLVEAGAPPRWYDFAAPETAVRVRLAHDPVNLG